ncbi:uncharacterized protein N7477_000943 [Penicillium maclennaniae]|uniref:uncharacterized protein n=1 Tax=Penicillium maclennaniae TaxID=1343394 RepID=UPI002541D079|nr:uncharacterized protein N7477_000943 [Penicillium maclennaniae]KAJ5684598.1 hypothetical protein N7477_000943 [Penicillium maclennaniae]
MNSSKPIMNRGNGTLKISLAAPQDGAMSPVIRSLLALRGRVKVQFTKGSGVSYDRHQEGPIYKQLLLPERHTLFQGPLHIPDSNDSVYWPFEIKMSPYSQDLGFLNGDLLPSWEDIASSRLPGTFYSVECNKASSPSACWVEYYLEAEMRYVERGDQKVHTSTCPIQVRHSPETIFRGFGKERRILNRSIRGQQLLSAVHHGERSFVRRTREFFIHPSISAPELHYKVEVYAPATVQLGNLSNIPYKLKFELLPQTSNALHDIELKVLFNSAKFIIRSETRVTAGTSVHAPSSVHCSLIDLGLEEAIRRLDAFPLTIPLTNKSQTLNIGKMLQLTLHTSGLKAGEKDVPATGRITPTFSTQNLRHLNSLQAEFSVTVAGNTTQLHASTPLNILAEL